MSTDFIDYFNLQHECADTIAGQLESGLRKYIEELKPGQRLPTEKELTEKLNVGRNTLRRAMNKLTDEKLLVRVRRKGTFVASDSIKRKTVESPGEINPMAWHGFDLVASPPPKATEITIALFENMPEQKKMWEEIVGIYNRTSEREKARIDWLPGDLDFSHNPDRLKGHYLRQGFFPDIVQCSMDYRFKELMQKLPETIPLSLQKEIYLTHNPRQFGKELLNYIVPVYTVLPLCVWNKELADKYKIDNVSEKVSMKQLADIWREAKDKLPEDVIIGGTIPNFFRFAGHPPIDSINLDFFRHIFAEAELMLQDCLIPERERVMGLYFKDYNLTDRFIGGKNFMHFNLGLTLRRDFGRDVKQKCAINVYVPEMKISYSFSALGIYKESANAAAAEKFINFIYSRKCQRLIASRLIALPVRWQCVDAVKDEFPEFSVDAAVRLKDHIINDNRLSLRDILFQIDFISYGLSGIFDEFIQKALPVDTAAAKAYDLWLDFIKDR